MENYEQKYNEVYDSLLKEAWKKHDQCLLSLGYKKEFPRYERHYTKLFAL